MNKGKRLLSYLLVAALLGSTIVVNPTVSQAKKKTRKVVVEGIRGNILYYYLARKKSTVISGSKSSYRVGTGKRRQIKINASTKFYLRDMTNKSKNKVDRAEFRDGVGKLKQKKAKDGTVYYKGNYCKIKLVGGRCTKITQKYQ
ncbi:MAG: hypothetical protein K6G62_03075 [Eubacterium sp.]|nr:hypothetical protein [Eubacterium sp.]